MNDERDYEASYGDGRPNHSELDKNLSRAVDRSAERVGARVAEAMKTLGGL
jgi:hypothetical protein